MSYISFSTPLTEEQLLKKITQNQTQVLCVGEAGSGKSSLSKRLAYLWAKDRPLFTNITAVVLITPEEEGENFEKTIRNAVPGSDANKDSVVSLFKKEPEALLFIVDAIEDFRKVDVIKTIRLMIKHKSCHLLVNLRKNSSKFQNDFYSLFEIRIDLMGFTPNEAGAYVNKCMKELGCEREESTLLEAIRNKPNIETNPLNLMLACCLYSEGHLKADDLETLTDVKLFGMRESKMVERECEQKDIDDEQEIDEVRKLQKLALYLKYNNETQCKISDLRALQIYSNSPVMVLLQKHEGFNTGTGYEKYWTWPHVRLMEYDAARALADIPNFKDSLWLLGVANTSELNSVAQLLVAILGSEKRYDEVMTLTTATLLLQKKVECKSSSHMRRNCCCDRIINVKGKLTATLSLEQFVGSNKNYTKDVGIITNDTASIKECCGKLLQGNVVLFQHLQHCWKLGLDRDLHQDYIRSNYAISLPAVDR